MQQIGPNIHVTDQDGSTYIGTIERQALKEPRDLAVQSQKPTIAGQLGAAEVKDKVGDRFYFRAEGIDTTLGKPLLFEGNYTITAALRIG